MGTNVFVEGLFLSGLDTEVGRAELITMKCGSFELRKRSSPRNDVVQKSERLADSNIVSALHL